ncbi:membrane protein US8A [Chimpanzee herpesvirus strain 105640]|uniref:Membrane protein US8A n=1 Tax=Chimpanzee herpesvirus strain 105640 TaxID=332937 RepID=K9MHE4_9ALPH|nr:membrane protein US8A [Chimpanzee herpesvirus strain 105640]AFV26958.1 membrane protein US8A [Chimpanzee herpesvirus strain 105640]
MDPALRSYHQRLRLYTPIARGVNLAARSQPLVREARDVVTPRPPIRPSCGKASYDNADVGDELIAIADARGDPPKTRPPGEVPTVPACHRPPYSCSPAAFPVALHAVDAPSQFVTWLAVRWLRGVVGLGAVLCGIAFYVTSIARGT